MRSLLYLSALLAAGAAAALAGAPFASWAGKARVGTPPFSVPQSSGIPLAGDDARGGDAVQGRDFAERNCAACHALAGPGPSPDPAAPPLSEIGRDYPVEYLAEALAEGIVVGAGAPHMPAYQLSTQEIDDLLAYLAGIQR